MIGNERGSIGNLFGIALDQAWLRWAAAEGVTETVIAAVSLLHERSVEEVAGKLTPEELADVTRLVSRAREAHYPPGVFDALKALRNVAAEKPATHTTAGAGANRPPRGAHLLNWARIPNAPALLNELIARMKQGSWNELELPPILPTSYTSWPTPRRVFPSARS